MADLPIWSDNERIDSEAVLASVWAWIRSYPVTGLTLLGYLFAIVHWRRPGEPELDLPCKMRKCNEENRQRCAEENRWMHFVWFRVYSGSRRAGTWSIEDCFHEPVRFPGLRSSDMGSMRLLWLCQEVDMDVLDKDQRFEELFALRETKRKSFQRSQICSIVTKFIAFMNALCICIWRSLWHSSFLLASCSTATNAIWPEICL
jgi:hypothetical protein